MCKLLDRTLNRLKGFKGSKTGWCAFAGLRHIASSKGFGAHMIFQSLQLEIQPPDAGFRIGFVHELGVIRGMKTCWRQIVGGS